MERLIIPAGPADYPEIVALVNSAYRGEMARSGWTHESDFFSGPRTDSQSLAESLGGAYPSMMLCLRRQPAGPILACVYLKKKQAESGGGTSCYVGMLTVAPDSQALGLGRIMLEESERQARMWDAEHMVIQVLFMREPLIAWYERRGYRRTGETVPFPYETAKGAGALREDLHFIILKKSF